MPFERPAAADQTLRGAGIIFVTPDGRALFLRRSENAKHPGEWDFPGGHADGDETALETARREAIEEIGDIPESRHRLHVLTDFITDDGIDSVTFVQRIDKPFEPTLDANEHDEFQWAPLSRPPEPLRSWIEPLLPMAEGAGIGMDAGEWNEADHPRDEGGRFGEGGAPGPAARKSAEASQAAKKSDTGGGKGSASYEFPTHGEHRIYHEGGSEGASGGARKEIGKVTRQWYEQIGSDPDGGAEKIKSMLKGMSNEQVKAFASVFGNLIGRGKFEKFADALRNASSAEFNRRAMGGWAQDADTLAMDRATAERIALDRASTRSYDEDGRLHVTLCPISKAVVNPYYGFEIPDAEELGLDARRVYYLLRDPQELAKGAATFNNIPILSDHKPVSADSPEKDLVIGSTGTDAVFKAPYLMNSLVFWDQEAIDDIEGDEKRELSAAYRYVADMTPGEFEGRRYDGVMREIRGNHIALVRDGRAGSDVIVGDSLLREHISMFTAQQNLSRKALLAKGALIGYLAAGASPLLAKDARPTFRKDLDKILSGVASDNWKAAKPKIVAALKPKLASDASAEGLAKLLDNLEGESASQNDPAVPGGTDEGAKEGAVAPPVAQPPGAPLVEGENPDEEGAPMAEDDPFGEILEALKAHLPPDKHAWLAEKLKGMRPHAGHAEIEPAAPAQDQPPGGPGQPKPPIGEPQKEETKVETVTKPAMDAALAAVREQTRKETMAQMRAIAEAEAFVQPWVGKLNMAFDSADDVYKAALQAMDYDLKGIHPSAFRHVLAAQPKPGTGNGERPRMATDSATVANHVKELFPGALKMRVMG